MELSKFFDARGLFVVLGFVNFLSSIAYSFLIISAASNLAGGIEGKYLFGVLIFATSALIAAMIHKVAARFYRFSANKVSFWTSYIGFTAVFLILSLKLFGSIPFGNF